MAIQILPKELTSSEQIGGAISQGLGSGLQQLLQNMAQQKARQMQTMQIGRGLQGLGLNITPEQANTIASLPESTLNQFIKQKLQEPQQQAYSEALQSILGNQPTQQQPQQQLIEQQPTTQLSTAPSISSNIPKGLNAQQATKLAELGLQKQKFREEQQTAKQRHYEKLYNKKIESIEEEGKRAGKAFNITQRMADIIKKDKAQLGSVVANKFIPNAWLNKDTQELISLGNDLVLKRASLGKGVPTKFRLAMEELAKPAIWMKPEVALSRIKDIQDELIDDVAESKALENIQEKYGINENFKKQLAIEKKKQLSELKKIEESKITKEQISFLQKLNITEDEIQELNSLPNNSVVETDNGIIIKENGQWKLRK